MAARRLLIVMLVLLGISSVIAVMIPSPENNGPGPEETAVTGETGATGAEESEVSGSSDRSASKVRRESVSVDSGDPVDVKAATGSRLILTVRSRQGSDVEIEGLGLAAFADPYAPAVFDLILPPDPGRYAVKALGEDPAAVIVTGSTSRR